MQKIIYKGENNGVVVLVPSPSWKGTLEELALKDVPKNTPWKIIDSSELPADLTFRNAWEWSEEYD